MKIGLEALAALKPSQYRPIMKSGWNQRRLNPLFKKFGEKRGYRIYLPFGDLDLSLPLEAPPEIVDHLRTQKVVVEDYRRGIGLDSHKRPVRIGRYFKGRPDLSKKFANDPRRAGANLKDLTVVVSRHPYDIAGMSTNRGWTSCMNLDDGAYKEKVPEEIKVGTLVAYLLPKGDRNINKPIARCLIKPYKLGRKTVYGVDYPYPKGTPQFREFLQKWVDKHINKSAGAGVAAINNRSYVDGKPEMVVGIHTEEGRKLMLVDNKYRELAIMQDPNIIMNFTGDLFAASIDLAILNLVSEETLKAKMSEIRKLSVFSKNNIVRYHPNMLSSIYTTAESDSVLDVMDDFDFPSQPLIHYAHNMPESSRGSWLAECAMRLRGDHLKAFIAEFKDEIRLDDILESENKPKSNELFTLLGVYEQRHEVLKIVRKIGMRAFEGNEHLIEKFFAPTPDGDWLDLVNALLTSIPETHMRNIMTNLSGMGSLMSTRMVYDYPYIVKALIENDPRFIMMVTCQVPATSDGTKKLVNLVREAAEIDPDIYRYIRGTIGGESIKFIKRLYGRIGIEHAMKSLCWHKLPLAIQKECIEDDIEIPEYMFEEAVLLPNKNRNVLYDALYAANLIDRNSISRQYARFLAFRNFPESLDACEWLAYNPYEIKKMKSGVDVNAYLNKFRVLHANYGLPLMEFELATKFINELR